MTDENPESPVKPQVIDLSAEEVTEVKPEAEPAKAAPAPAPRRRGIFRWLIPALMLSVIAGGWLYRDVLAGYFPTSATTELGNRISAMEANDKALQDRLNAMVASIDAANATASHLDQQVKGAQSAAAEATGKIDAFEARIASSEQIIANLRGDFENLGNAISQGGTSGGSADAAALAALGQRLDALEKEVASLKSGAVTPGDQSQAAGLSQALADLKAKVAAGTAFQAEYDRINSMVPAAPGLDVLAQHAAKGLPAASGLASELRDLIPSLPAPEQPAAAGGSYWDSIWNGLTAIITIRDIGVADWRDLAENAAVLADGGDLISAIARIDEAEGAKPAGLTQWRDRAAQRLKLEKAVEETAAAVLRQITALGGAQ